MNKNSVRRGLAAAAVLGVVGGAAVCGAAAASAATNDAVQCDADQLSVTLVHGEPGAGNRFAFLQFTALPGQYCELDGALPFTLAYASGVSVVLDNSNATPVDLTPGDSANEQLHWVAVQAEEDQVIPGSLTVQTDGPLGDTVTLPWNQGPVDDYVSGIVHDNKITVSAVQAGPAVDN
ncbi:MAG TPA: DUF4232 domain-containing protein [Pseudonocardiaceae bacterium]|jgi:hypothetical protein|nr:DUF4232 domain-containing protein [Pseudonocardiaceae bacterium]